MWPRLLSGVQWSSEDRSIPIWPANLYEFQHKNELTCRSGARLQTGCAGKWMGLFLRSDELGQWKTAVNSVVWTRSSSFRKRKVAYLCWIQCNTSGVTTYFICFIYNVIINCIIYCVLLTHFIFMSLSSPTCYRMIRPGRRLMLSPTNKNTNCQFKLYLMYSVLHIT
jgi:hypothetical protein